MNKQIRDIAKLARKARKTMDDQEQYAWEMISKDKKLLKSVLEACVRKAIRENIYELRDGEMSALKFAPGRTTRGIEGMSAISDVMNSAFLDTWMVGDRVLGDVLGKELEPLAQDSFGEAKGWTMRGMFLQAIAKKVKGNKSVRSAIGNKAAANLWDNIKKSMDAKGEVG